MEIPPLRSKAARAAASGDEEGEAGSARDQTPLPERGEEDWSTLGATRIIPAGSGSANTALKPDDTALPEAPAPEKQGRFGDFRLLKKLGEGAMGIVFKAHQISFDREVALKVLHKRVAANPKLVERLEREARAMGMHLDHPNIVCAYGHGEHQGWRYVAMEYVDGESLQAWLDRVGKVSIGDALRIIITCARALAHAHDQGLVHRDVKPDNILITRGGDIKVADLGMVKHLDDEEMTLTQTGHAVGTPWYMPLEQAKNAKEIDGRCDIYALGCMLYCLITGQPPFTGKTLVEVIEAKERGTFPPARKTCPDVPEKLDMIILKMTAKLRDHRYRNCGEAIKDLESLGLAGSTLTFLSGPARSRRGDKAPSPSKTVDTSIPGSGDVAQAADIWYLRFRNAEGKVLVRKLTTAQVLKVAASEDFDLTAKASRQPQEGFRALATYREFEHLMLARVSKSGADEQTVRYRALYKKIEEQELKRERREEKTVTNFSYWLGIALKFGGIGLGIALLILLLRYLANGLGN